MEKKKPNLRTIQIIVAAMAGGMLTFLVIAVALAKTVAADPNQDLTNVLLICLGTLAVAETTAFMLVRFSIKTKARREWQAVEDKSDPIGRISPLFFNTVLVGAAMIEGVSLFAIVIHLISGHWIGIVAALVGLILLALQFPTVEKQRRFVENATGERLL